MLNARFFVILGITLSAAAIPFFRNTLAGDAAYTLVLFGGFALAQRYLPVLREQPVGIPVQVCLK
jgi:hypothetical protein